MTTRPASLASLVASAPIPIAVLVAAIVAACGSASGGGSGDGLDPDTGIGVGDGGVETAPPFDAPAPPDTPSTTGPYADFPSAPYLDGDATGKAPASAPTLFGPAGSGAASGGPCLAEPEVGSLFPRNWLRPRFRMAAGGGQNLFEIRLHTSAEKSDLVAYTTAPIWTMPADVWKGLQTHAVDVPITMTVRGAVYDAASGKLTAGPFVGSSGTFTIAPADAAGTIVYWMLPSGAGETSNLKGFTVGDETVTEVLKPAQIGSACIGCHTSTPDGTFVAVSSSDNPGDGSGSAWMEIRSLKDPTSGPPFMTASAKSLLARKDQHGPAFSRAHWTGGDHVALTQFPVAGKTEIVWTDLESTALDEGKGWGVLPRTGDANAAGGANWSHDGSKVVYFSAPAIGAGVIDGAGQSDLFVVPYADKKGGAATKLYGDPAFSSYYPQFSADDQLVAFNRVARGQTSYNDAAAEVFVVPASGAGTPTRLVANDPPACTGGKSPGITNSWPKWSPKATPSGTKTYYWLTFSSTRGAGNPQIYVTGVVVDGGVVTTYPALYLWNQPAAEHNHTPAWDVFSLPIH